MTTFEEMLAKRPIDPAVLEAKVQAMEEEARLYRLKEMRKDNGLTQAELAKIMGTSQNRVSQIENGKLETTKISTLQKYVESLGCSMFISIESPDGTYFSIPASAAGKHLATA